jgi:hypothetical protein
MKMLIVSCKPHPHSALPPNIQIAPSPDLHAHALPCGSPSANAYTYPTGRICDASTSERTRATVHPYVQVGAQVWAEYGVMRSCACLLLLPVPSLPAPHPSRSHLLGGRPGAGLKLVVGDDEGGLGT